MLRTTTNFGFSQALVEAQRCLSCYQAPCTQACPAKVDVPGFIRRFREDNLRGASELIYESCPLGCTCGTACPTSVLCEGACVLTQLGQTPIRIGSLQSFITASSPLEEPPPKQKSQSKVAIIGSGPAGIGCAVQLNRLGVQAEIFERDRQPGGMVTHVIPAHRLPAEPMETDLMRLQNSGIRFHYNQEVNAAKVNQFLNEYDAVFAGIGLGGENQPHQTGMQAAGVYAALEFLQQARSAAFGDGTPPQLGKRVLVVGGGNVALDAAVVAKRLGAEQVLVVYRRSKEEMPGWESEYLEACSLGVEFRWLSVIDEIITNQDQLQAVKISQMRFVSASLGGRRWVEHDSEIPVYTLHCDTLIFALGQTLEEGIQEVMGLQKNAPLLPVNEGSFQTPRPGLFSAGEAVSGGSTIVACMSAGMKAAREIAQYLQSQDTKGGQHG
ncbi:MAG: FAD-dependent oxidoreductase [Anaerolineaceae bacterium]|nr:FAD-dependent oxidoreductase [Anaerolineaceae bacterium]